MKFLSPEVAFYLLKLLYGLAWNNAGMSGLVLLSATWICSISYRIEYVGVFVFHLLFFINSWAHVVSLGLLYRYYVNTYLSEMAELPPLSHFRGRSTRYFNRLHDFSVTISRCYKGVNSFFSR